jgi:hypothetical protein
VIVGHGDHQCLSRNDFTFEFAGKCERCASNDHESDKQSGDDDFHVQHLSAIYISAN